MQFGRAKALCYGIKFNIWFKIYIYRVWIMPLRISENR